MEEVLDDPSAFQFFQAVRLLERHAADKKPVGFDAHPSDETVRFISRVSYGFPASDLADLPPTKSDDKAPRLMVSFMGLANPASFGSLPSAYVDRIQLLDRLERAKDRGPGQPRRKHCALRAFLDCFNHRLISLFYRAWKKHHFAVAYERDRKDVLEDVLFSVIGLGAPALRGRLHFDDRALLFQAGHLARSCATASGLTDVLNDYFQVPIEVQEFVPSWHTIEASDQYRIGSREGRLGEDIVLGCRIRTGEFHFRVRLGPLRWDQYESFLPQGSEHRKLVNLVRLAVGRGLDFDVQLVLLSSEVPRLRVTNVEESAFRLGWSTWMDHDRSGPPRGEGLFSVRDLKATT